MSFKSSILKSFPIWLQQPLRKLYYLRSFKKNYRAEEFRFFDVLIKLGDVVVDVGANIGIYTKYFSKLAGPEGCVLSVEPVPSTFEILKFNMNKLKLSNVKLFDCAVSNFEGQAQMVIPLNPTGGDDFYRAFITNTSGADAVKVKVKKIDSLLSNMSKVDFVKIDVEGHELKVLEGAMDTIKKFKPKFFIEITNNPSEENSDSFLIFDMMTNLGYEIFWPNGSELKKYCHGDQSVNYFFLPRT